MEIYRDIFMDNEKVSFIFFLPSLNMIIHIFTMLYREGKLEKS